MERMADLVGGFSKKGKGKDDRSGLGKDHSRRDDKCYFCDEKGHWEKDCLKQLWYTTQKKSKGNNAGNDGNKDSGSGPGSGEGSSTAVVNYNWKQAGQYPRPYTAALTYFAATLQTKSPNVWLFDSACNANITCFKQCLINYHEFP